MLTSRPITPILPVTDLDRAKRFYMTNLGLRPSNEKSSPDVVLFETGGHQKLELMKQDKPVKSDHTAISFEVDDIEREVKELEGRGVRFEDYDMPGIKTERHIAKVNGDRTAWFKDTEGNILCIHQVVGRR